MPKRAKILYGEIANILRQRILDGTYEPGSMVATEEDLCKMFDVSRITAKRALNDLADEGLIRRIRSKGSFVNYHAQTIRKAVTTGRQGHIALVTRASGENALRVFSGVDSRLRAMGYRTSFITLGTLEHGPNTEEERAAIEELLLDDIQGLILWPADTRGSSTVLERLRAAGMPTVLLDRTVENCPNPCVLSDHAQGASDVVRHLITCGHSRIAFLGQTDNWATALTERLNGYYRALIEAGLTIHPELIWVPEIYRSQMSSPVGPANWIEWFHWVIAKENPDRATAVFALTDYPAIDAVVLASRMGLKIPEDLAVTGFDNSAVSKGSIVSLTTVNQDWEQIGSTAAELLQKMIGGEEISEKIVRIPTTLIVRESTSMSTPSQSLT